MHISNVLVLCRIQIANAELHYCHNRKGSAAECLSELGAYLSEQLPGRSTNASTAAPEAEDAPDKEPTESPEGNEIEIIHVAEKKSQETQ